MVETVKKETVDKILSWLPNVINMLEFGKEYKRSDLIKYGYPDEFINQAISNYFFVVRKGFANDFIHIHNELKKYVNFN